MIKLSLQKGYNIFFSSDLHGYHKNICYGTSTWSDKDEACRKFDTPEEMITTQLQRWLQKTGLFSAVVLDPQQASDLILETAVTGLYGVKRPDLPSQSILEMQFFMTDQHATTDEVIFQTGLHIDINIAETTPPNVVKGWKTGLEKLLSTLEDDLSGYFADNTPQ